MMDDARAIGESVRAARRYAALTQGDLADLAGVSERTVRTIETGTGNPSLAAVVAVVNTLGLHLGAA
jgi:putative transcriptional regulator